MFSNYFFIKNKYQNLNRTAVITEKKIQISYATLYKDIKKYSKNIKRKSVLLLLCTNNYSTLIAYMCCLFTKTVPILVDENIRPEKFKKIIRNFKPDYIFSSKNINFMEKKYFVKNINNTFLICRNTISQKNNLDPKISLLLSSSGSTGSLKFIKISLKNIRHNTKTIIQYLGLTKNDKTIINLPFSYSYGLSVVNTHLYAGAKIFLCNHSVISKEFWTIFKSFKPTNFNGVPYTYNLISKLYIKKIDFSCLKFISQAGGKLNKKYLEELIAVSKKYKFNIFVMYGQTEASPRISYLEPKLIERKIESIGKTLKGGKIWLENNNKKRIHQANTEGELIYKGPNVFIGYAKNRHDLTIKGKGFTSDILKTGDLAKFDDEGYIYITGRKNRYSKILGNRINLEEVEEILSQNNFSSICSVQKDFLNIYCETKSNPRDLLNIIKNSTTIPTNRCKVHLIKNIPRNMSGKIIYNNFKKN